MTAPSGSAAFRCEVVEEGSRVALTLGGELDVYTSDILRTRVDELNDLAGRHVVVDIASVGFIDSSGLSALVHTLKRVEDSGGIVTLRNPSDRVLKLLEISGLARLFRID